jgi:plastocyanin
MTIRSFTFVVVVVTALTVACEGRSPQPVGPSASQGIEATTASASGQLAAASSAEHAVTMFDACDPDTFNAAVGPGTCTRPGGVRFDSFVAELTKHQSVGAWHFAPSQVMMRVGQQLVANNRGGETHTFTEVENFGGGVVGFLNDLVGLKTVAPECSSAVFLPPGASSRETEHEAGVEKYQCCIHPWMRAEVRIAEK